MIIEKLVLGITLAAPMGPVSVEMIKRGINNGFLSALSIRLGGAIGNTLCLIGAYFGLSQIMKYPLLINLLGLIGASLLFYMGMKALLKKIETIEAQPKSNIRNGLVWGFYLAIANPVALVFWPGIFAASINSVDDINLWGLAENMLIIVGVVLWGIGLSLFLGLGHRFITPRFTLWITRISGILMLYYGSTYLWVIGNRLMS